MRSIVITLKAGTPNSFSTARIVSSVPGTAYILAIGVNAYSNSQYNLKYAVADATAFGAEVQRSQQQIANYDHVEVALLLDDQATKANILRALRRLAGTDDVSATDAPAALSKAEAYSTGRRRLHLFRGARNCSGATLLSFAARPGLRRENERSLMPRVCKRFSNTASRMKRWSERLKE